jgi:hypothetical protein
MSSEPTLISTPPINLNVRARSFGKHVLYTGLAHAKTGDPLEVTMLDLTFRFTFIDAGGPTPRIATNVLGPKALELQLYNFTSPLGVGFTEPLHIGSIAGRNLYLMMTVYAIGNTPVKTVFCTFLQDPITTYAPKVDG